MELIARDVAKIDFELFEEIKSKTKAKTAAEFKSDVLWAFVNYVDRDKLKRYLSENL